MCNCICDVHRVLADRIKTKECFLNNSILPWQNLEFLWYKNNQKNQRSHLNLKLSSTKENSFGNIILPLQQGWHEKLLTLQDNLNDTNIKSPHLMIAENRWNM